MFLDPLTAMLRNYQTGIQSSDRNQSQMIPGNIDLYNRPIVSRGNGNYSTVDTIGVEMDGKHIVLPQISEDGRIMTPEEAINEYRRTGKHLGMFNAQEEADEYAQKLHQDQEKYYGQNGMSSQYHPMIQSIMNMLQMGGY